MLDLEYTPNPEQILTTSQLCGYDTRIFDKQHGDDHAQLEARIASLEQRLTAVEEEISYVEKEIAP